MHLPQTSAWCYFPPPRAVPTLLEVWTCVIMHAVSMDWEPTAPMAAPFLAPAETHARTERCIPLQLPSILMEDKARENAPHHPVRTKIWSAHSKSPIQNKVFHQEWQPTKVAETLPEYKYQHRNSGSTVKSRAVRCCQKNPVIFD